MLNNKKIYFRHEHFRNEQDKIIKDIFDALNLKQSILIHAPTGTGKTDASLSAAISFAIEHNKKILFLTPKIAQHKIALEVVRDINEKYDTDLKAIDFVGKKNLCVDPVVSKVSSGFYEVCKNAIEKKQCPFYLNIKPTNKTERELLRYKLEKELNSRKTLSHSEIKEIAINFKSVSNKPLPLCAYELAKIYARSCTIIVADYYHVFSKTIADSLLPEIGIDLSECILIVDEAHNLEDRVLKLLSKSLNTLHLTRAIKEASDMKNPKLREVLDNILHNMEGLNETKLKAKNLLRKPKNNFNKEEFIQKEDLIPQKYQEHILELIIEIEETGIKYLEKTNETRSALINVALFLEQWILNLKAHTRFVTFENNLVSVKYNALDISLVTKDIFEKVYCAIIMSATLTPLVMYKEIFGLPNATLLKEYSSPFDSKNKLDLLVTDVTTKYTQRGEEEYIKITNYITKIINATPGNIIIFFPSFEILRRIAEQIKINKPKVIQEEKSTQFDFEEQIKEFKSHSNRFGGALFAVMGGKASEGIDLPGNFVIAAVIVGIPLGRMDIYTTAKINYYETKYKKGWAYAYIQPAIQKTIQSAGRVIRSTTDKGVIIYLDQRYGWQNYRQYLPRTLRFKITNKPEEDIYNFFK